MSNDAVGLVGRDNLTARVFQELRLALMEGRFRPGHRFFQRGTSIVAADEFVSLFGKIERRLQARDHLKQRLTNGAGISTEAPFQVRQRELRL